MEVRSLCEYFARPRPPVSILVRQCDGHVYTRPKDIVAESHPCRKTSLEAAAMNASLKPVSSDADAERSARVDLAACCRLAAHFGLNEGIDNHLTLLVPGYPDRFLLAPFGLHWSEVRASDFMVIDFNGLALSGRGPIEDTALDIHLPVHRLAP